MISFFKALGEPDSGLVHTKYSNVSPGRQEILETCIDSDGNFDHGLYHGLKTTIPVREFKDIVEALVVTRDRNEAYRMWEEKRMRRSRDKVDPTSQSAHVELVEALKKRVK